MGVWGGGDFGERGRARGSYIVVGLFGLRCCLVGCSHGLLMFDDTSVYTGWHCGGGISEWVYCLSWLGYTRVWRNRRELVDLSGA